jgi:hypothetical protein
MVIVFFHSPEKRSWALFIRTENAQGVLDASAPRMRSTCNILWKTINLQRAKSIDGRYLIIARPLLVLASIAYVKLTLSIRPSEKATNAKSV